MNPLLPQPGGLADRSDEELAALAQGPPDVSAAIAFEARAVLVRRYDPHLRRLARFHSRSAGPGYNAADAHQDLVIEMLKGIARYRPAPVGCFRAFILGLVRQRGISMARAHLRHEHHLDRSVLAARALDARLSGEEGDHRQGFPDAASDDPAFLAERSECLESVSRTVANLGDRQRRVLELRLQGWHFPAIAADLEVSPQTARRCWSDAVIRLQERCGGRPLAS